MQDQMGLAHEHVDHCDVLITSCFHVTEGNRAMGTCVAFGEDLSALDLLALAETLNVVAARILAMANRRGEAN